MMYPETQKEAVRRLENEFHFKKRGEYLTQGICPNCKYKELYAYAEAPWTLQCNRRSKCAHVVYLRDLYPDLFENWEKRFEPTKENPTATVDAYLVEGRGFPIDKLRGHYTQEYYKLWGTDLGSVTIRFPIIDDPNNVGYWERCLDDKGKLPKTPNPKNFKMQGHGWAPPETDLINVEEIWITEGIFDSIALWLSGVTTFSALTCNNYPSILLNRIAEQCKKEDKPRPKIVWAFDADQAGRDGIDKNIERAKTDGWDCAAALPPSGWNKTDWNDLYKQERLTETDLKNYRYYGDLHTAERPVDKAILMFKRTKSNSFPFDFHNRLYWFKMNADEYTAKLREAGMNEDDNEDWLQKEKEEFEEKSIDQAIRSCCSVTEIANCKPTALYYQYSAEIDDAKYYFRIDFPKNAHPVKNTFTGGQLSAASEFKKRLLAVAPGVIYTGNGAQLDRVLRNTIENIRRVQLINYIGYHHELETYVLGDIAVQHGKTYPINADDYFALPRQINLKANVPFNLKINKEQGEYKKEWIDDLIQAYDVRGLITLTAFFGSLFVQQIRKKHKSFPFLEIVGHAGTGKSTMLNFMWKLLGRQDNNGDYEGLDPNKTSESGLIRTFRQVSNLPVLLIESDRSGENQPYTRQFNWDMLKTLYDGGSLGARGMKTGGNETYDPPFMGSLIVSQNAEINGSEAIKGRFLHIGFEKKHLTQQSLAASKRLQKYKIEDVSYFILSCLEKEEKILETYEQLQEEYDDMIRSSYTIENSRIIHNHAQFMALFKSMAKHVIQIDEETQRQVISELGEMAIQRDKALQQDSVIVQNFWDTYEQIEAQKSFTEDTVLNHHSKRHKYIAINFAHLYNVAANLRFNLPEVRELQDALRQSIRYKFLDSNKMVASKIQNGKSVRCWLFEVPSETSTND